MALYGFGLAADALAKSLAKGPETGLEIEAGMPAFEQAVLQNMKTKQAMEEERLNQPLNRLKRQAEIDTLNARAPYISQLAEADVASKLAEVPHKQAQTAKLLTEAQTLGLEGKVDAKGNYTFVDRRMGSPTFGQVVASGQAPETIEDILKQEKLLAETEKLGTEIPEIKARTGKTVAETGQIGQLTPLQQYLQKIDWYGRLLKAKELAAERVHQSQIARLEPERRNRYQQIEDDARAEVQRALSNELGKVQIPGASIEEQNAIMRYLVNRQVAEKVSDWNKMFGDKLSLPVPSVLPHPEWDKLLKTQPEAPGFLSRLSGLLGSSQAKPAVDPARKARYQAVFGSDIESDAQQNGISVEDILNDPEIKQMLGE